MKIKWEISVAIFDLGLGISLLATAWQNPISICFSIFKTCIGFLCLIAGSIVLGMED